MATAITIFYFCRDLNRVFMHAFILTQKATSFLHKHQQTCSIRFSHFTWQNLKPKTMSLDFKLKLTDDPPNTKKWEETLLRPALLLQQLIWIMVGHYTKEPNV